jgi:formamidopyrimidine-DNA glycosylase
MQPSRALESRGKSKMPELPEIELLKRELASQVVGRRVTRIHFPGDEPGVDKSSLLGAVIAQVRRRGKMLVIEFDSDQALIVHLMMAGQLLLSPPFDGEPRDVRMTLYFGDGSRLTLGQVDLKYVHLLPVDEVEAWPGIKKLGVDALDDAFTTGRLEQILTRRRGAIKSCLLNQAHVAGIGNTYADEILFQARLHPGRNAGGLSSEEIERLYTCIVATLRRGIELGGSSEMAFVHLNGTAGSFQEHFRVKRRNGEPCSLCSTPIERIKVGGRGTYYCPQCQPT